MTQVEEKAHKAAKFVSPNVTTLDPMLILTIISIIISIANFMFNHCKKSHKQIVDIAQNPSPFAKWRAWRIARMHLDSTKFKGMEWEVVEGIINAHKNVTIDEVKECVGYRL